MGVGATFPIITKRLGEGGVTSGIEVKRIQQMLARTGHNPKSNIDGGWGKNTSTTAKAWTAYQQSKGWIPRNYIDPVDSEDRLGMLAFDSGVALYLAPQLRSYSGALSVAELAIAFNIPYGWGKHGDGTKMIWGFEGRPYAMIFTKPGTKAAAEFDVSSKDARAYNCCSFAQVLLSVWNTGGVHAAPYDALQDVGGDGKQIGERFGMPEVKNSAGKQGFKSLDELTGVLQSDRIYHLALCLGSGVLTTKHDVIVVNKTVFQANVKEVSPLGGAVYTLPLAEQWSRMSVKHVRLFGPGPF